MVDAKSHDILFRCERSEGKITEEFRRQLIECDLCVENHSGCYKYDEWWGKKSEAGL